MRDAQNWQGTTEYSSSTGNRESPCCSRAAHCSRRPAASETSMKALKPLTAGGPLSTMPSFWKIAAGIGLPLLRQKESAWNKPNSAAHVK